MAAPWMPSGVRCLAALRLPAPSALATRTSPRAWPIHRAVATRAAAGPARIDGMMNPAPAQPLADRAPRVSASAPASPPASASASAFPSLGAFASAFAAASPATVAPPVAPQTTQTFPAPRAGPVPLLSEEDAVVELFINTVMQDGKKAVARAVVAEALHVVQRHTTAMSPRQYLVQAIDRVAPLMKLNSQSRGAKAVVSPVPIGERARRRTAMKWILKAINRRKHRRIATGQLLGNELIKIHEGTSAALERKRNVYITALANRSNVLLTDRPIKRRFF